ncbi:VirK/YbjX family protein [Selenomonas ruminis]|uniref:DUF535 domain-containing protein n=1 Tax=Selenomonas ruminis TaxID=2593411 RepID=A0A5D6WAQ7_9FIRM|nr:VirK/YbjX family protein [Selenomonas sp. mPRGC5]TYZ24069.1 DUF535 domain-containing protein [Selenomonas sp. mPRGC5]
MIDFITIGKQIYDVKNWREKHRLIVFLLRVYLHYGDMKNLYTFFCEDSLRKATFQAKFYPLEQVTRGFFYKGSTFQERAELIKNHYRYLQEKLLPEKFTDLCQSRNVKIWQSADEDVDWQASLFFHIGQRKEGLLSVVMLFGGQPLYQIMFWLNKDKNGEDALWIGAMQGPNMEGARELVKDTTKRAHRYRTKNLILYMTMAVARALGVRHIYAVSNDGYYAMNHVRRDRKLKTDFGAFWEEAGGHVTDDPRFYEIPLIEPRKTMEEVPTRKRAVYRKRFAFQDDVDAQITANMEKIFK